MKKIIIFLLLFVILTGFSKQSYSQTPTDSKSASSSATASPLNEDEMKNVKKIIDLVASNSASQKQTEKHGVLGKVSTTSSTSITIQVYSGENRIIDIDEITKFSDGSSKTYGISDIKNGDVLGVIGIFNKISEHILGRSVTKISTVPIYFEGVITDIDKKEFTLNAVDESGHKKLINIETSTKITSFTKDDGQLKSGFSKIKTGQRVYVAGFDDLKIKDQINADRLIFFPELSISQKMKNYLDLEKQSAGTPSAEPTK